MALAVPRAATGVGICLGVALVIVLAAFVADGGLRLGPTTNVEIGFLLVGGATCSAALVHPRSRTQPLYGATALLGFALLAGCTALSIGWSVAPADSWLEASRTLSYLALFAGSLALGRMAPHRWPAVLHGIALACVVVCAWALLTKVFPGALAATERAARLRAPFGYWNSVGLMAAAGIMPLLWLGARRSGHAAANALAWPGIALLIVCLMLSYSRGGLIAVGVGLAFWFAFVPLRLRGAIVLMGALAGAVPITAWAFSMTGLSADDIPVAVRADAGHELGALLLLMSVVLFLAGLAAGFLAAESPPSPGAKRLAGRVLIGLLAIVPIVALLALHAAPGGIGGQVSKAWRVATDPSAGTPTNTPDRLTSTASVRARYWKEAFDIHASSPWLGTGAGAYATSRTRFRTGTLIVRHAHGYVPQTLADDGDPVDVLVITPFPLSAGIVVTCRPIGVLKMEDEAGGDAKLLAVPIDKILPIYRHWQKPEDMHDLRLHQIQHFFEHYKDLEKGKWVKVEGWAGPDEARKEILAGVEAYNKEHSK